MGYILQERLGWDNLGGEEVERMREVYSLVGRGQSRMGGLFEVEGGADIDVTFWGCH